jgi:hypothetical protein
MNLIGNSVSVPVIEILSKAIIDTGVFKQEETHNNKILRRAISVTPFATAIDRATYVCR